MEQSVIGEQCVDEITRPLEFGQFPHPLEMGGALTIEEILRGPIGHQRQDDLDEQDGLQVGIRLDRLGQPHVQFAHAVVGDDVALAVGPAPGSASAAMILPSRASRPSVV